MDIFCSQVVSNREMAQDPVNKMNGAPDADIAVFTEALRLPPEERDHYLDKACKGDSESRRRVEALLQAYEQAGDFLGRPAADRPERAAQAFPAGEKPGDRIGHYRLLQQIGEGGCGVVYMAEQEAPIRRRVALKIIKPGMDTKSVIARFEAERQALASMNHPNIAKVFDAGATESGRPYFIMELIRGVKITDYCDQHSLTTEDRLKLFVQVCQAVQHAHQKGIIHRDIKPSNILVTQSLKGVATPVVIDFGVAKATTGQPLTDKTVFTAFEMLIGTPAYMSPEQATLSSVDVDTRTDIYSLGVLLYELLTGTTPLDTHELLKAGFDEVRRVIRDEAPVRPSTRLTTMTAADLVRVSKHHGADGTKLIRQMRGELDWIVMKALEKDRTRRYATANDLGMDIQRYLSGEAVLACPPSRFYQFRKLVSRYKLEFAALGIVMATLLVGLSITTWSLAREKAARSEANQQRKKAELGEQKALTEATRSGEVARFLNDMLPSGDPLLADGRGAETMLHGMLDRAAMRVGTELTNQPAVQADLRMTIGRVYANLGLYERAETMIQGALTFYRGLPDNEEMVARARNLLASIYTRQGRRAQAQEEARSALAIIVKLEGEENMDFVSLQTKLAGADLAEGKPADAVSRARKALAIGRRLLGDQSGVLLNTKFALAEALDSQGNIVEAEDLARDCLSVAQKEYGSNAIEAATSMSFLAYFLERQGKLADAETVIRQSVAILRSNLPPAHPMLEEALWSLGRELQQEGKNEEAANAERELLGIRRKLYRDGDDRIWETATTLVKMLVPDLDETKLADLAGEIPEALAVLSEDLAEHGRWRDARKAAARFLEMQPGNPSAYHIMAPLLVQTADRTAYEELCQKIATRFAGSTDPRIADRMAKDCLILPRPGELAETAVTKGEKDTGALPFFQCCKALAEYRLGNWKGATNWASRPATNSSPYVRAEADAILAMAQFQLKHAEDARDALNKCTEVVGTELPKFTEENIGGDWRDWIIAHALQSEAKQIIDGEPSIAHPANLPQ
jgi:serine/threonine protein kinase/tetratricopeptide (TPR) repeat protein